MSTRIRNQPTRTYPRLVVTQLILTGKSGSLVGNLIIGSVSIATLYASLRDGTVLSGTASGGAAGATITSNPPNGAVLGPLGLAFFDPTTENLSIAGAFVTTPANLALVSFDVGGQDLGVSVDQATTGTLFAEVLTFGATSLKVSKIANAAQPQQMPVRQDIQVVAQVALANLAADQLVQIQVAFWVTPREDLK